MKLILLFLQISLACSFAPSPWFVTLLPSTSKSVTATRASPSTTLHGWLDNFLPAPIEADDSQRRKDFPEQYPATYELNDIVIESDGMSKEAQLIRPLLKQTMLESRPLQLVYDANLHGWDARSFHQRVDGKGGAIVVATYQSNASETVSVGGYNPKGWSSNGGARPSVAAFLFYQKNVAGSSGSSAEKNNFQKLQKVGGGGLACANDDPNYGISLGPDSLVISLQEGRERFASSKLGPYFERGPENLSSLFKEVGGGVQLSSLKVLTGVYGADEEIPYAGAVMDMTSG